MFRHVLTAAVALAVACAARPAAAQVSSALPADRLAFANQLAKRGLYAEALGEYEALRGEKTLPKDELLFRLGEAYRQTGRAHDALGCYGALLHETPESKYADYARLSRALLQDGAARAKELQDLDRDDTPPAVRATALYHLGELAEAANDTRTAADRYTRAAKLTPAADVARLARLRAAALLAASPDAADRRRALLAYLDLAEAKDPRLAEEALFFAAMLGYRERRYAEAAALFQRLRTAFPAGARAKESALYAAWANHLAGRPAEALKLASPLRADGSEDAHYITAASLRALERRADAVAAYDAALQAFPQGTYADAEWTERLGVLAASGDHAAVLATLAARGDPPDASAARAWTFGCEAAVAVTNFPRAIEFARRAAARKDSPYAPGAAHRLAWLLEKTGDWGQAAAAWRALAETWPTNAVAAQARYQAGAAEAKGGRPDRARDDWTRLLADHPDSKFAPDALHARAMEELRAKDYRAANRSLSDLAARFPAVAARPETLYWRGVAAFGAGEPQEAEKHLRAARDAHPAAEFDREIRLELAAALRTNGKDAEAAALLAGLLDTKAVGRLSSDDLKWTAEAMLAATNWAAAAKAAAVLEARSSDAAWRQTAAALAGAAHEGAGARDAAAADYARALQADARTEAGIRAALALGRIETDTGLFDAAKEHLADAVSRAGSREHAAFRVQAYAALARNEEERGDTAAALGYHMLVGTLFDDPAETPRALARAADILRAQGKAKDADGLLAELKSRYPGAAKTK